MLASSFISVPWSRLVGCWLCWEDRRGAGAATEGGGGQRGGGLLDCGSSDSDADVYAVERVLKEADGAGGTGGIRT